MKRITEWSFRNKAAMIVVMTLVLVLGSVSYFALPMEFLPEADNPQVVIATLGQGYDAASMEQTVTHPIEEAVSTVKGKRDVFSETGDGYSQVVLNFDYRTNMKEATQAVRDALSSITLPEGMSKPHVVQLNTSMIPISQVSLSFDDGFTETNMEKVEQHILPQFQNIPGVANVAVYGKTDPRIVVNIDHDKMAELGIPLQAVTGLLEGQNFAISAGEQSVDGKMSNIKVLGNLDGIDALRNTTIPVALPNAPSVRLKDIAEIEQKTEQESVTRINGEEALALTVTKDSESSAVNVAQDVKRTVEKLNADNDDVKADIIYSSADMIENSVNSMLREVLLGALFATIVIMVFLRNIRATMITIVSIPLSLGLTLLLLWQSGVTLNILTLGGIAVVIGRLVDDSIVVVENIYRRMQSKQLTQASIVAATKEVGKAITSSTLVTVVVFLPMGLIEGSLRSFLLPFALTVSYSLLASLLVAVTVVPLMSAKLFQTVQLTRQKKPQRYLRLLQWSLNHKFVPIMTAIVVFVAAIVLYVMMPKGAIGAEDASIVNVNMKYTSDTPVDKVKEKALQLEKKILQLHGHSDVVTQVGSSSDDAEWGEVASPTEANLTVVLQEGTDAAHIVKEINDEKNNFPDADIAVATASMMSMQTSEITYDLIGDDPQDLDKAAQEVVKAIDGVDGVKKVSSNQEEKKTVYEVVVDTTKANTQQTAMQLRALLNETPIGTIRLADRDIPVTMNTNISANSNEDLQKLQLQTADGMIPLSSVASIKEKQLSSTLLHKDGDRYVRISAEIEPEQLSVISQKLSAELQKVTLPQNVKLETGGASSQQASEFADLGLMMLTSIGIVYLIMVITFKSIRAPLAILMTIPLAAIGSVLGLIVTNVSVDPTALIGALMLIGIVVTNAIVLIDRVKQNEKTLSIREAIVEAAGTRLRPILMTAIATIFAMLPLLFGPAEDGSLVSKGLAVVVIGGLTVSTALTLVIIPVFYELLHFRKSRNQRYQLEQNRQQRVKDNA